MVGLSEILVKELKVTFEMINDAISKLDGEFWKQDENDWNYGYILFHVIEAIDFYLEDSADVWKPMTEISQNSREKETEALKGVDQSYFYNYLNQVEEKAIEVLNQLGDDLLLENDGFAPRGFISRYHKLSYVIRHSMFHLGELTKSLRNNELDRIEWR